MRQSALFTRLAKTFHAEICGFARGRAPIAGGFYKPLHLRLASVYIGAGNVSFRYEWLYSAGETLHESFFEFRCATVPDDASFCSAKWYIGKSVFECHGTRESGNFRFSNIWRHADAAFARAERGIVDDQKPLHPDFRIVDFYYEFR